MGYSHSEITKFSGAVQIHMGHTGDQELRRKIMVSSAVVSVAFIAIVVTYSQFRDPWYMKLCPLTSSGLSYEERLQNGLDPNFMVEAPNGDLVDIVFWHGRSGKCSNGDLLRMLKIKHKYGGTILPRDAERIKAHYNEWPDGEEIYTQVQLMN